MRLLCPGPMPVEGAGCRYRLAQYLPALRAAGTAPALAALHSATAFSLAQWGRKAWLFTLDSLRRVVALAGSRNVVGALVYREAFPISSALLERWLARSGLPII